MSPMTPSQRLATVLLGTPLKDWVKERRRDGQSWRAISEELHEATEGQVAVSFETLRTWFPDGANGGTEAA